MKKLLSILTVPGTDEALSFDPVSNTLQRNEFLVPADGGLPDFVTGQKTAELSCLRIIPETKYPARNTLGSVL